MSLFVPVTKCNKRGGCSTTSQLLINSPSTVCPRAVHPQNAFLQKSPFIKRPLPNVLFSRYPLHKTSRLQNFLLHNILCQNVPLLEILDPIAHFMADVWQNFIRGCLYSIRETLSLYFLPVYCHSFAFRHAISCLSVLCLLLPPIFLHPAFLSSAGLFPARLSFSCQPTLTSFYPPSLCLPAENFESSYPLVFLSPVCLNVACLPACCLPATFQSVCPPACLSV